MSTDTKVLVFLFAITCCILFFSNTSCSSTRKTYMSLEHLQTIYFDEKYFLNPYFKTRRVNRKDPVYYLTLNFTAVKALDNNFTISLYFYQLLSNVYKRSFVEIHTKYCDLIEKDALIGEAFREVFYRVPEKERPMLDLKCPSVPGRYCYPNMRFKFTGIIDVFPFQEGRIYTNVTYKGQAAASGSIDFQIKALRTSKK